MNSRDLDAYFERIGHRASTEPTLETLHAITTAHAQSIPFENLDVLRSRTIDLDSDAIVRKLVHDRRGGYCFEQNGLLLLVLEALGYEVSALAARVRLQRPAGFIPPRTHMFLRVDIDGDAWLTDVGIGGVSLTGAIRLQPDVEQRTPHEPRRIVADGSRWLHQVSFSGEWVDVCEFTLEEMPPIDREIANWFTSAHPRSHFRDRLVAARAAPNGMRLTLVNDEFSVRQPGGQRQVEIIRSADELLRTLADHFQLHFPPGTRFGPPGSPWPS